MRLLFLIGNLACGGAERVAATLANHWAAKGWKITLVTYEAQDPDFYKLHPSVKRLALDLPGGGGNMFRAIINLPHRVWALRRVLREERSDVALSLMITSNMLLALAAWRLSGVTAVGSEQIHPPAIPSLGRLREWLRAVLYGCLSAISAPTLESGTWLRSNTFAKRVPVIPNAVPWPLPVHMPVVEPAQVLPPGHRIMLAIGRLERQKGFDLLIGTFANLATVHPDWLLVIIGEGSEQSALEDLVRVNALSDRVIFPGRIGNIGHWYEAADLYVMSSRFEGFGLTLAEAMAHGLPVVSFDCETGPREIIRHDVDGLLVPPGNVEGLKAALHRIMADGALRAKFAEQAVEARKRFSIERIAQMWEALFEELRRQAGI